MSGCLWFNKKKKKKDQKPSERLDLDPKKIIPDLQQAGVLIPSK
jgi:hypothetical protein